jgi:heme exporter protein A
MGLTVESLSCVRGGRRVLHDVGFDVADGETLLLRGPNGAGKSTLLRALAGLLPAEGQVALDGRVQAEDRDGFSEAVAYVGHLDAVKPQLTVVENLRFWAGMCGGSAESALAAFDLEAIADQPAHLCSAGQKRRAALARLALGGRRLWLLDEPTVSLDAAAEARLVAAIDDHATAGGCAVVATHAPLGVARTRTLELATRRGGGEDPFLTGTWA